MGKIKYYAVYRGRSTGIFTAWNDCLESTRGFSGARFKSFNTEKMAQDWIDSLSRHAPKTKLDSIAPLAMKRREFVDKSQICCEEDEVAATSSECIEPPMTIAYTDGSCNENGKGNSFAGYGVFFGDDDPRNISEKLQGPGATNNRAEMTAVIRAMMVADPTLPLQIQSDSQYTINGIEDWIFNCEQNDSVKMACTLNRDLLAEVKKLKDEFRKAPTYFVYVEAHCGIHGNEMADILAKAGRFK